MLCFSPEMQNYSFISTVGTRNAWPSFLFSVSPVSRPFKLQPLWNAQCKWLVARSLKTSCKKSHAPCEGWTHDLQIMRLTRCLLRQRGPQYRENVWEKKSIFKSIRTMKDYYQALPAMVFAASDFYWLRSSSLTLWSLVCSIDRHSVR